MPTFRDQLRNNTVALISLCVALTSLGYNTWRNEHTEYNRNIRTASFEILMRLADLKRLTYRAQYDHDANPRTGWTYVLAIRDLCDLVPERVPTQAAVLQKVWGENWEGLGREDEKAVNRIDDAIDDLRRATLETLQALR